LYIDALSCIERSFYFPIVSTFVLHLFSYIHIFDVYLQSLFTTSLSQRVRHVRWRHGRDAKKSAAGAVGDTADTPPPAKKRVIVRDAPIARVTLSEEEYSSHLKELQTEWDKPSGKSSVHIKTLLRETFPNNQEFIKGLPDGQVAAILDRLPCYRDVTYVSIQIQLVLGHDRFCIISVRTC
jgi:hypothetical protein